MLFVQISLEVGTDQSGLRKNEGAFCGCVNENSSRGWKHVFIL